MKTKTAYAIGQTFIRMENKRNDVETVVDILTTTNAKGKVVRIEYVAEHTFMGQIVRNTALNVTIAKGIFNQQLLEKLNKVKK